MRQSEQSKKWMAEALLALMEEMPYGAITVKNITEKAGVARLTFYRNFERKDDILRYHLMEGFEEYRTQLRQEEKLDLQQTIALCYRFWEGRKEEIRLLIEQDLAWLIREPFEECLRSVLAEVGLSARFSEFQIHFLTGGMFSGMLAWLECSGAQTPEEIAREILGMIRITQGNEKENG